MKNMCLNNLFAIIMHWMLCAVFLIPVGFTWRFGIWRVGENMIIFNLVLVGIFTAIAFFLYFVVGRKLLDPTHNSLTNLLSVAIVPCVISIAVIIAWSNTETLGMLSLLAFPIHPIGETISFFLPLGQPRGHIIASLLPAIAMWLGLTTKKNRKAT